MAFALVSIVFFNKRNICLVSIDCSNGVKDPFETDVDCGGVCVALGKKCNNTQNCSVDSDCQSDSCLNGTCGSKYPVFGRNVTYVWFP